MATTNDPFMPEKASVDGLTFYMRNGKRVVRKRKENVSEHRLTPARALQACKISNVNAVWRMSNQQLTPLFERPAPGKTAYNVFMSQNITHARVLLSKEQSRWHYGVADRFIVSSGSLLPNVEVAEEEGFYVSNLAIGDLAVTEETPWFFLAAAVLGHNKGWVHPGDRVTLVLMRQRGSLEGQQTPMVEVETATLALTTAVTGPAGQMVDTRHWHNRGGFLAFPKREGELATWVLRRPQLKGGDKVTSQQLCGDNALVEKFTNTVAKYDAMMSYGPLKENIAAPGYEEFQALAQEARRLKLGQ